METLLLMVAGVLIAEGLAYALAPSLVERMLDAVRAVPHETRRLFGMGAIATGIAILWLVQA